VIGSGLSIPFRLAGKVPGFSRRTGNFVDLLDRNAVLAATAVSQNQAVASQFP
jgi:hypothetical protein